MFVVVSNLRADESAQAREEKRMGGNSRCKRECSGVRNKTKFLDHGRQRGNVQRSTLEGESARVMSRESRAQTHEVSSTRVKTSRHVR